MQKNNIVSLLIVLLVGCTNRLSSEYPDSAATTQVVQPSPMENKSVWSIYDADPEHLWNRAFRQFYERVGRNGVAYGADELDPLLWFDTTYLLNGASHQQALQVLDEFLTTHGEDLIHEPLKRAMFQRDMWAVFDWLASQPEPYPAERTALKTRLAQIIRWVSLSKAEIVSLPDNYALEIKARTYPTTFEVAQPEKAFLPADIFEPDSAWVPIGRDGGPNAMTHTESFPFFGRSVFLVFVRSPDGRMATLDFIESLNTETNPVVATGSEVALVRRMLLIDDQGDLVLAPLMETFQIRHFSPQQRFHEFELKRARLFDRVAGGLVEKMKVFLLFMSHGDIFEADHGPELQAAIPEICKACHFETSPFPNSGTIHSIISYSRDPFPLPENEKPMFFATTVTDEAQTVSIWKQNHSTWQAIHTLWGQTGP